MNVYFVNNNTRYIEGDRKLCHAMIYSHTIIVITIK